MLKITPITVAKTGPLKITIEGCTGSGKTAMMNQIIQLLSSENSFTNITAHRQEVLYITLQQQMPKGCFIAQEPFHLERTGDITFKQIGHGEYSQAIEKYIPIKTVNDYPLRVGDHIYICDEGVYTLHEVVPFTVKYD